MKYILKDIIYEGSPIVNGDNLEQRITIITCIEGDIYNFIKTDYTSAFSNMSKSGNEIKQDVIIQAIDFINKQYPNT